MCEQAARLPRYEMLPITVMYLAIIVNLMQEYPWTPEPVNRLTSAVASEINDATSIIFFTDNTEEASEILKPIAVKYFESLKTGAVSENIRFFYHNEDDDDDDDDIGTSLKTFANLETEVPLLVLMDIPNKKVSFLHQLFNI